MNDLTRIAADNPAEVTGYPPSLPIEIALKIATLPELKAEYGFSDEEWAALRYNPLFLADLKSAHEKVKDGQSFKLKAQLQAEELLTESWKMIHSSAELVPPSVKADLIKSTIRWAGYDNKAAAEAGGQSNAFQINIQLR